MPTDEGHFKAAAVTHLMTRHLTRQLGEENPRKVTSRGAAVAAEYLRLFTTGAWLLFPFDRKLVLRRVHMR